MPPCLDVYIETARSEARLTEFLARYADLATDGLRPEYEIWRWDTQEHVRTGTLAATLAHGLVDGRRSFTLYLRGRAASHSYVLVHFGGPAQLLLGLSVEASAAGGASNAPAAERLLAQLKAEFDAPKGLIALELAPVDAAEQLWAG